MNLIVQPITSCRMRLTWEFPPEEVNAGLDGIEAGIRNELKRLSRKPKEWKQGPKSKLSGKNGQDGIPAAFRGFRPHAVPREMLWQHMAGDIRKRYIDKILPQLWKEAIAENALQPIGKPRFDALDVNRDSAMKIVAEVEIVPRIALSQVQYRGLVVEVPVREDISDQAINQSLEQYRHQHVVFRAAGDGDRAEDGDLLIIRCQERPFGAGDDAWTPEQTMQAQIGAGNFQPILQQMLSGMKAGEAKQYVHDANGQPMEIRVVVDDLKKRQLPSLEGLAIQEGCAGVEDLLVGIRKRLEENAVLLYQANLRRVLMAAIMGRLEAPMELPEMIVRERFNLLWREAHMTAMRQGRKMEENEENKRSLWQLADRLAKEELILDEIARMEALSVEAEEEGAEISRIAARDGESRESVREWIERDGKLPLIHRQILWNKVLKLLAGWAKIQESIRLEVGISHA